MTQLKPASVMARTMAQHEPPCAIRSQKVKDSRICDCVCVALEGGKNGRAAAGTVTFNPTRTMMDDDDGMTTSDGGESERHKGGVVW